MSNYQVYNELVRAYKRQLDLPLSIKRVKMSDSYDGVCEKKDGKFFIKINKNLKENSACDCVIHEVAHALAWGLEDNFHGAKWGEKYAFAYRIFLKELVDIDEEKK